MADKEIRDGLASSLASNVAVDELEEVWQLFVEDGKEALDLVEETLLALESDPTDAGQIARLFRGLHTFKGNARMMGLEVFESLAHHAEDLIAVVRDEGVVLTVEMIELLLEILDHSRGMLDYTLAHRCDVDAAEVEELVARLMDVLEDSAGARVVAQDKAGEAVRVVELDFSDDGKDDTFILDALEEAESSVVSVDTDPILVEKLIDPATDPGYVRIFMEMADAGMDRLGDALEALADGEVEGSIQEISVVADTLAYAAGQMGYGRLSVMLDDLAAAVADLDGEARVAELKRLESAISQELTAVSSIARPPAPDSRRDRLVEQVEATVGEVLAEEICEPEPLEQMVEPPQVPQPFELVQDERVLKPSGVSQRFRHWCEADMLTALARLGEAMDNLEQFTRQFLVGGSALTWDEELVNEVSYLLRIIYHSCAFHGMDRSAHVTLALEDLYARVAQGEMSVSETLLNLTRTFIDQLSGVVEFACAGAVSEDAGLLALLDQSKELLYLHAEGRAFQAARDTLRLLDLPPEFEDAMTRENLSEVSRALRAGERFYTVLADLNQYEEVGQAFYEWSRSDVVRLITNVTVFQDDHTLFNFLLATPAPPGILLADLGRMDPQGDCLSLEECVLQEGVEPERAVRAELARPTARQTMQATDSRGDVSTKALASILENVGELVATRATLHRVTERLTKDDLIETVTRLVKRSDGDWQSVHTELQASLGSWADDLSTLARAETEMGAALDQFREAALALRARPAAEILDPLRRLALDVAQYLGKVVDLEVEGADVELDRGALDILADPVRRLVWFAVAHGIEKPVDRWETDKPAAGHILVVVRKTADHAYIVIEDDGCGIDPAAILARARELGWTRDEHIPAGKLSEWVFRDGFGLVGGSYDVEGIDLAAINDELQAHRGRLDVSTEPGQGTRFSIDVLLDTVVIDGMVVRVGEVHYVMPIEAVRRIVKPEESQIVRSSADNGQRMLRLEDELLPIQTLAGQSRVPVAEGLLLVIEAGEQSYALAVDELIGQQQVLTQPLQGHLADVEFISGCALLGEGDVGVVLDLSRVNARM